MSAPRTGIEFAMALKDLLQHLGVNVVTSRHDGESLVAIDELIPMAERYILNSSTIAGQIQDERERVASSASYVGDLGEGVIIGLDKAERIVRKMIDG